MTVTIQVMKAIRDVRVKIDDVLHIMKIENFLSIIKQDSTKKQFIRDVRTLL